MRYWLTILFLLLAAPSFATVDPVGWWKFNDGSGVTATDSGSGGNAGTLVNTPTWVAGHIGSNALQFNYDDNQYVDIGTPGAVGITGNMTISIWFNLDSVPGANVYYPLAVKGYTSAAPDKEQYLFRFANNGGLQTVDCGTYENGNNHIAQYTYGSDITTGTWYNLICRFDGSTWKIYLNGTEKASLNDSTAPQSNSAKFIIGGEEVDGTVERWFDGSLDDARLYNRAITTQEISDLVNQTEGGGVVARHKPIIIQ